MAEDPSGEVTFEEALAEAMDPEPPSTADSREEVHVSRSSTHSLPEPAEYAFAQGPGYSSGVGTRGYGEDSSEGPDDLAGSVSSEDSGVSRYAFATGPGYGSGVGTSGYGEDSSAGPNDLANVVPSSERIAKKYASTAQLGHDSNVSIEGYGKNWNQST